MIVTRIPCPGNLMLVIDPEGLADLYARLLRGETWKSVAKFAGCSDTGLKRCLIRAGYEVEIRRLREAKIGKTRNIVKQSSSADLSVKYLSMPLRVSV